MWQNAEFADMWGIKPCLVVLLLFDLGCMMCLRRVGGYGEGGGGCVLVRYIMRGRKLWPHIPVSMLVTPIADCSIYRAGRIYLHYLAILWHGSSTNCENSTSDSMIWALEPVLLSLFWPRNRVGFLPE